MATGGAKRGIGPQEAERIKRLLQTYNKQDTAAIVKRHPSAITGLINRNFRPAWTGLRPVPSDWGIMSARMTVHQIARHYSANTNTVKRWAEEAGRNYAPKPSWRPAYPIPSDLAETMKHMAPGEAAKHYGVSRDLLLQWRHKMGLIVKSSKPKSQFKWWERKAA